MQTKLQLETECLKLNPFRADITKAFRCADVMGKCNGVIVENNKKGNIRTM